MGNIIRKICDGNEKDVEMGELNKRNSIASNIPISIPPETYAKLLDMINDSTKETIEIKENIKNINHTLETIQCRIGFIEKNNTEKDDIVLSEHKKMIEFIDIFNAKFGPIKPDTAKLESDTKFFEAQRPTLPFKSEVLTSRFENKPSIRSRKNINQDDSFNFTYIN